MTKRFNSLEYLINLGILPDCPESKQNSRESLIICRLNDKPCVKEHWGRCDYYDDWLFEEKQKEVDKLGKESQ